VTTLPPDPFHRTCPPRSLTREGRVLLLGEACEALLAGHMPEREAAVLLAAGMLSWLDGDRSDLARDHWQISARQGSHERPQAIWARLKTSCAMSDSDDAACPNAASSTSQGE
jgi:hypothetical protein